jgi:2-polyprenyl-6-methoxyphenol hydroxylase-like FAD-dependent oxidoreductase
LHSNGIRSGKLDTVLGADVLYVLAAGGVEVRRGCRPTALRETARGVEVELDDGTVETADVVVGCDGVHSSVRSLRFGDVAGFDTGWTLWTWWCRPERFVADTVREWWTAGCFFGAYPAPGRVMCAAGGPTPAAAVVTPDDLRPLLAPLTEHVGLIGAVLSDADRLFPWPMRDVRAGHWVTGHVALCGDAAAAFLPTAGVGASNAMRAAAALADELSRVDASTIGLGLELYERRARRVVERNQSESRRLARVMFVRRPRLAWMRDQITRRYPAQRAVKQIIASMHTPF